MSAEDVGIVQAIYEAFNRGGLGIWLSGFAPGFEYRLDEIIDGPDAVLLRLTLHGRGRESGVELERPSFNAWELRDGRPFRCRIFSDEAEARRAAGLEA